MQCQLAFSRLVNSTLGLLLCLFVALGGHAVALAAPGDLDPSFGTGGIVITSFGGTDVASAVVIQPDGKLVVAGRTNIAGNTVFALARYNPNGGLDVPTPDTEGFGTGGLVTTDFGSTDQAFAVALQGDGKIVTAGRRGSDVIVARYNANGSVDSSFGSTTGRVITNFGATEQALALVIQPDGKIVVAGRTNKPAPNGNFDFALARYEAAGTLDLTFGTAGLVTTDFGGSVDRAFAMALQPDGKLVVVGDSDANFALARYNPNGSLDPGFGADGSGKVITSFGGTDQASAVILQPDGKIVVAGQTDTGISTDFALARYMPDGSLDGTFGSGGRVTTNFTGNSDDLGSAVVLQSDGKIVVGGTSEDNFALARYTPEGALDIPFGIEGKVTTNLGGEDVLHALALQPDGAIVAVGESADRFAVARYQAFGQVSLRLVLNPEATTVFKVGDPFRFDLILNNPGLQQTADLYFAILLPAATAGFNCPAGDPLVLFGPGFSVTTRCLSDPQGFTPFSTNMVIPSGTSITENFFSGVWPAGAAAGVYTFSVALVRSDTGEVIDVKSASATLTP
jgi:uncharacterized delta-60 repeat protein